MGLFGGDSSSTQVTNLDETNVQNIDNRVVEGEDVNVGGNVSIVADGSLENVNVVSTDFGALDKATRIAGGAFDFGQRTFETTTDLLAESIESTNRTLGDTLRDTFNKASNTLSDTISNVTASAASTTKGALGLASEATRDEAARTQQLLIVGGVTLGIALLFFGTKRRAK